MPTTLNKTWTELLATKAIDLPDTAPEKDVDLVMFDVECAQSLPPADIGVPVLFMFHPAAKTVAKSAFLRCIDQLVSEFGTLFLFWDRESRWWYLTAAEPERVSETLIRYERTDNGRWKATVLSAS